MAQLIDEVSRALATGMPRRKVLKLLVTGVAGLALGRELEVETPPPVEAGRRFFTGIVWPTPADITYGTPLGTQQLDALAFIQGNLISLYTVKPCLSPAAPSRTQKQVGLKTTPAPQMRTPAPQMRRQQLRMLNALCLKNVPNYDYTPASGAVLPVGSSQLLHVTTATTPVMSASTHINVVKDPTTLAVASALYLPLPGHWRFIADITTTPAQLASTASRPTGSVTFRLDGTALAPPATVSGSRAIYTAPTLTTGQHTVGAGYSGDGNFLGSTAPNLIIQQS